MYPYLFGHPDLWMYDLIGACGLLLVLGFFLWRKTWPVEPGAAATEHIARYADRESVPLRGKPRFWAVLGVALPLVVHLVFFALGGERFATLVGRSTEFLGYVFFSAVGMVLTAGALGYPPLRWLDRTVPLYLTMATVLKLSCFCAGCCYGQPWEQGLYNHRSQQTEFPIQLVEMALYGILLWLLPRYKGRPGRRFLLFLSAYGGVRFLVQFFRADRPIFGSFHWMSGIACAVGLIGLALEWAITAKRKKET